MFELSIAKKYLKPNWRQLSVSIISLISILVISLVVWLIVVFFSVTNGLEKGWVEKLIALTAPIRVTPIDEYYNSYYYQIDAVSENSDYTLKNLSEKLQQNSEDPYNPSFDQQLPSSFPKPLLNEDGSLKDLIKELHQSVQALDQEIKEDLQIEDYEVTMSHLKVKLKRSFGSTTKESLISQAAYLASYSPENKLLKKTLLPISNEDLENQQRNKREENEKGLLLPKIFKEAGVLVGDEATLTYYTPTLSAVQEQQKKTFIAGFYDPGLIPMGGKFVLASKDLVSLIAGSQSNEQTTPVNGLNIRFSDFQKAAIVKKKLEAELKNRGIDSFFKVETYEEYEFTKDILGQLKSDKTLFSLISGIIIIVACSNIISMLIIMVNDKKTEIGILRSLGASSFSIASIFGFCGIVMGMMGSLIGITAAYFTLKNMDILIRFLNSIQGQRAFNPLFYGETLPSEISFEALLFVVMATTLISLVAGIVPAVKATTLRPSAILRSE